MKRPPKPIDWRTSLLKEGIIRSVDVPFSLFSLGFDATISYSSVGESKDNLFPPVLRGPTLVQMTAFRDFSFRRVWRTCSDSSLFAAPVK